MATQKRKKPAAMSTLAKTVDDYLAAAPKEQRAALTRLRKTIKAAAPKATESISYGMAGFKHRGESLVLFAYWKDHVALYGSFSAQAAELKAYDQSGKGTFRFQIDEPLPYGLVTSMVKGRLAEIEKERTGPAATVDGYLASVPRETRGALAKLRADIKAAAPEATDGISYQVPVFKLDGKGLVGFGAGRSPSAGRPALYSMSTTSAMRARLAQLKKDGYQVAGATIHFSPDKPLSAALVRAIVKARVAEIKRKG
jgi:uncharacterized protein YdhG (YjbR/CyaY superfamily)